MVVVMATAMVSTVAMIQMKTTITMLDADEAANLVVSQLTYARQAAVDDRRNILVQFLNNNEIKVTRNETGGGTTVLADVTLPTAYRFSLPAGVSDTPDNF